MAFPKITADQPQRKYNGKGRGSKGRQTAHRLQCTVKHCSHHRGQFGRLSCRHRSLLAFPAWTATLTMFGWKCQMTLRCLQPYPHIAVVTPNWPPCEHTGGISWLRQLWLKAGSLSIVHTLVGELQACLRCNCHPLFSEAVLELLLGL